MALYALSDLHLSLSANKPMDVFGSSWHNYMERIYNNWQSVVSDDDLCIIGGDISWAMYLDDALEDLRFLDSLPGRKLLVRGNHDYWWESLAKLKAFTASNGFESVSFLQNDGFLYGDCSIAGTRGWLLPGSDGFGADDRKIYERELIRLELSLQGVRRMEEQSGISGFRRIAVLHYPPVDSSGNPDEGISAILARYGVSECIYGHLHGPAVRSAFCGVSGGIRYRLTSADYLEFMPCNLDL